MACVFPSGLLTLTLMIAALIPCGQSEDFLQADCSEVVRQRKLKIRIDSAGLQKASWTSTTPTIRISYVNADSDCETADEEDKNAFKTIQQINSFLGNLQNPKEGNEIMKNENECLCSCKNHCKYGSKAMGEALLQDRLLGLQRTQVFDLGFGSVEMGYGVKANINSGDDSCTKATQNLSGMCSSSNFPVPVIDLSMLTGVTVDLSEESTQSYAELLVSSGLMPFTSDDKDVDFQLARAMVLLNIDHPRDAIRELTSLIRENPNLFGAYHTRGAAYARKGLQTGNNAEKALRDFTKAIELNPKNPLGWEQRGEVYNLLAKFKEAYSDISRALELRPTAKFHFLRGTILFKEEKFFPATQDFVKSLNLDPEQSEVFHLLGISFYHLGKLHDAITSMQQAVELKPDCTDCLRSLGQAYRELGQFDKSYASFNTVLQLQPDHAQSYSLRGNLLFNSGRVSEALEDFKRCLTHEPFNAQCEYMKAVCLSTLGKYYDAVKTSSKVMTQGLQLLLIPEVGRAKYIREFSRYLHARLDSPIGEINMDADFSSEVKDHWAKGLPFPTESYEEQAGLEPDISDIDTLYFEDLDHNLQTLVCRGATLGALTEHSTDGYLSNKRLNLAMGLSSIEVAQTVKEYWKNPKIFRNPQGKKFGWRDVFDIGVKWIRYYNSDEPVFWLDMMSGLATQNGYHGYNNHMHLIRGHTFNVRYAEYYETIFNLTKKMLVQHGQQTSKVDEKFFLNINKINSFDKLMMLVRKLKASGDIGQGLMVATKISSHRKSAEKLEGAMFTLTGESLGNVVFSLDATTTKKRTEQFHTEMEHVWQQLTELLQNGKKTHTSSKDSDFDNVSNLILSLIYYFYNLMPLSRGSSSVAYSIAVGLFLAIGREVTGHIPKGRIVEVEAMLAGNPSIFTSTVKDWMKLQKLQQNITNLPPMKEVLPSLRTMLEALNSGAVGCP